MGSKGSKKDSGKGSRKGSRTMGRKGSRTMGNDTLPFALPPFHVLLQAAACRAIHRTGTPTTGKMSDLWHVGRHSSRPAHHCSESLQGARFCVGRW